MSQWPAAGAARPGGDDSSRWFLEIHEQHRVGRMRPREPPRVSQTAHQYFMTVRFLARTNLYNVSNCHEIHPRIPMRARSGVGRRSFRDYPPVRQSKRAQPDRAADGQSQNPGRKGRQTPLVPVESETQAAGLALRLQRADGWSARHEELPDRRRSRNSASARTAKPSRRPLSRSEERRVEKECRSRWSP